MSDHPAHIGACPDDDPGARSENVTKHPRQLERGANRYNLIHSIAGGETVANLARRYNVTTSAISQFKTRHADEIAAAQANIEDKLIGLWAAKKEARIAVYQQQIEDVALLENIAPPEMVARAQVALKAIAEEMGHLSARVAIQGDMGVQVSYTMNGVDPTDLT